VESLCFLIEYLYGSCLALLMFIWSETSICISSTSWQLYKKCIRKWIILVRLFGQHIVQVLSSVRPFEGVHVSFPPHQNRTVKAYQHCLSLFLCLVSTCKIWSLSVSPCIFEVCIHHLKNIQCANFHPWIHVLLLNLLDNLNPSRSS